MKILIISWRDIKHPWAGGSEVNLHEMAKYWVKWGHEVTLLCAKRYSGGQASSRGVIDGIDIVRVGGRYSLYILAPLYYLSKLRGKYDFIVDVENGIPFFTPLFCKTSKCCIVNHVHKEVFFTELRFPLSWIGYFIETRVFPILYRHIPVVALSSTTKNDLVSIGFNPGNIMIIRPGMNHHELRLDGTKFDSPTIIYLGRLRKYKRVHLLIDVFSEVKKIISVARLVIAGNGDAKPELDQIVKNAVYRNDIDLLGYVSEKEKIRLLQKSWVYVTPSSREGWGLAVLEANACGTPAIAFRVPGLSESIHNYHSGFLVETVAEMVEKIILVLSDKKLRKQLSAGAFEHARQFSWDRSSREYLNLFSAIRNGRYKIR
jgi:glycosyltransferase involved in cell wall biosynthesis